MLALQIHARLVVGEEGRSARERLEGVTDEEVDEERGGSGVSKGEKRGMSWRGVEGKEEGGE